MRLTVHRDLSLKSCTSLSVGGRAAVAYMPETVEQFRQILVGLWARQVDPFILGGGCNTLFPDGSFTRPVILTHKLRRLEISDRRVRAEAGVRLETLIRAAIGSGLGGLEMFKGIPGTVGGAVAMNAGGSGYCFGDLVRSVDAIDPATGQLARLEHADLRWGYRETDLGGHVVTGVEMELEPGDTGVLRERATSFMRKKALTQPLSSFSAGCVFKNPAGDSAARLIDTAGLKGRRVGHAMVSERHANFIVNRSGEATAADVLGLIRHVRERVRQCHGVELELELVLARETIAAGTSGAS